MPRTETTTLHRGPWTVGMLTGLLGVTVGYALLEPRAPGNVATGFLIGGLAVLTLAVVDRFRVRRGAARVGPAARWAAGAPDERDDRILTRSLAVVGYVGILASAVGMIATFAGADATLVLGVLPAVLLVTLVATFVVISRRS